jgi:hypothetical protein
LAISQHRLSDPKSNLAVPQDFLYTEDRWGERIEFHFSPHFQAELMMTHRLSWLVLFFVATDLCQPQTEAAVVGTTGSVLAIAPPPSIADGQLVSPTFAHLFQEKATLVLRPSLPVDVTSPGLVQTSADLTPGIIPSGTMIDSYYLMSDTPNTGRVPSIVTFAGTITFDAPVLGVIVTAPRLQQTDVALGANGTSYLPSHEFRGFDGPTFSGLSLAVADLLVLSANRRTITFDFKSESYSDQIRIITAVVPEPSTLLLAASVVLIVSTRRR